MFCLASALAVALALFGGAGRLEAIVLIVHVERSSMSSRFDSRSDASSDGAEIEGLVVIGPNATIGKRVALHDLVANFHEAALGHRRDDSRTASGLLQ